MNFNNSNNINTMLTSKYFLKLYIVLRILILPVVKDRWKIAAWTFFQTQRRFASSAAQWDRYQFHRRKSGKPRNPAARRSFQPVCAFCRLGYRSCSCQPCSVLLRSCWTRLPCRLWVGMGGKAFWTLQFVFGLDFL